MTKKDQAIIDTNPGKTPHELLLAGLSDKGYTELSSMENAPPAEPLKEVTKAKPTVTPNVQRAMPQVSDFVPSVVSDTVNLKDLKTGRIKPMSLGAASKMAKRYPSEFQIV